jgi:hypothetical protein
MAHWDEEKFNTRTPDPTIMCATCKNKMKAVEQSGKVYERYTFGKCDAYDRKPHDVLWEGAPCMMYEREV